MTMLALFICLFNPVQSHAASSSYQIEVNKTSNKLYLYKNGKVIWTRSIATGKNRTPISAGSKNIPKGATPEGTFPIVMKTINPQWKHVPGTVKKKVNGKIVQVPNPENPLGPRWHGLDVFGTKGTVYGIHGTNAPSSIGKHISMGCIRMNNADAIKLFEIVPKGTPVWIHSGKSDNRWKGNSKVGSKPATNSDNHSYTASYPGAQYFKKGANNKYVYQLGVMLQKVKFGKHYRVGPSNTFTEADRKNVQEFQLAQGWKGTKLGQAADGYPGPETWSRLVTKSNIMKVDTTKN